MNFHDPLVPQQREAKLRYLDHEFEILKEGEFVRCGMTGDPIRLDKLRYWSISKQMPYKSAGEAFQDYLQERGD
ncbi:MAG: DUF2093 domain-containing protein [Proteobacteria bacterium]|nr:DUF2093 domain-containing protein [Pseudomonadota bacterium]